MQSFFHSVSAVLVILLLTATGYFLGRIGYIRQEHKGMITKLAINVGLPCLCLNNLTDYFTRASLAEAGRMLLVPLGVILLLSALGALAARLLRLPHRQRGVFIVMCAFSNSVFIGMPMCMELFGEAATPYVMCYYLVNTGLFQTLGIALLDWSGKPKGERGGLWQNAKGLLKKPPLIALAASLALIWFDIPLPGVVMSYTKYMGALVSPLGLIYTGYVIYEHGLRNIRLERGLPGMLGVRFLLSPAATLAGCALLGMRGLARGVFLVEATMPTMTQTVVLSAMLGADEDYAALGAALSTLASFGVIPLLMLLL